MQTPATAQLRTAIEVLKKLRQRIDERAAHSVMQLPESRLGDDYAARIEARTLEQTTRIDGVIGELNCGRQELLQQRRPHVSHGV